jgi:LPXTG-motif cell wall-anchored protein
VRSVPVGGILAAFNKLAILAPYMTLVGLAVAITATAVVIKKRRKA